MSKWKPDTILPQNEAAVMVMLTGPWDLVALKLQESAGHGKMMFWCLGCRCLHLESTQQLRNDIQWVRKKSMPSNLGLKSANFPMVARRKPRVYSWRISTHPRIGKRVGGNLNEFKWYITILWNSWRDERILQSWLTCVDRVSYIPGEREACKVHIHHVSTVQKNGRHGYGTWHFSIWNEAWWVLANLQPTSFLQLTSRQPNLQH